MFSTSQSLQKRTPENGIGREEYIKLLADEYYETSDIGNYVLSYTLGYYI